MPPEYKAEKEASVSHLGGGPLWEINYVTLVAPAAAFLWAVLHSRQGFFKPYTLPALVSDFLLHCAAILFATTVYAEAPQTLIGLLVLPAVMAGLQPTTKRSVKAKANGKPAEPTESPESDARDPLPVKPFITSYRGAMMVVTCTSILAVDFPVFPRRFAKTESFGTSLMDMGVGSFVFAAGIVAARQQLKEDYSKSPPTIATRMRTAIRHSLPLVGLGFVRLWSVKGLDYAEHVSEYGVHWNFFFTLALLPPTIALLHPILRWCPSIGILAFVIAICYELALYLTTLKQYIILSPRIQGDWLSQNREGVFSYIGYLAIFLAGIGIGQGILPRDEDAALSFTPKRPEKDPLDEDAAWLADVLGQPLDDKDKGRAASESPPAFKPGPLPKLAIVHLAKWTGLWFIFSVWAMWRYGPRLFVSRRMANLAYVVWVCAFNTAQLLLFCGIEMVMFPKLYHAMDKQTERRRVSEATSKVLHAFNRNGLALFLLANLLTGVINMTVPTWHMGDVEAMAVLVTYIGVICAVGLTLDHYDISIKL